MSKKTKETKETKVIEKSSKMISGGRWQVQEDGSRVQVQAPTNINKTGER